MGHATTPPNLPTPLHPVTAFQKRISVGLPVRGGRGASAGFAVPHLSCPSFLIAGPGHAHPLPFYFSPPPEEGATAQHRKNRQWDHW